MFFIILKSMSVLCILIGLGYYFQKINLFDDNTRKKLTDLLLYYTLPCTFFMSLQVNFNSLLMDNALLCIIISFFMHILFILIGYTFCYIFKVKKANRGVIIFSMTFVNMSFMGFPVLLSFFPNATDNAIFYGSMFNLPFNILAFSFGTKILSSTKTTMKFSDFTSPVNIAIILGFMFFIMGIKTPYIISTSLKTLGQISIPLSLLLTGALLAKSKLSHIIKEPFLLVANFTRLIICPLIFYIILKQFNLDPKILKIGVILAMMPSASFTVILSERYGGNVDMAAKLVFSSTILSLFTIILISSILLH